MKNIITYTEAGLNAAKTVRAPKDFPYYSRGKFYTEVEVIIEGTGVIDAGSTIDITAKRIASTDDLTPLENFQIDATDLPQSVTYFGSFKDITATPNATLISSAGTYKLIINAGETY